MRTLLISGLLVVAAHAASLAQSPVTGFLFPSDTLYWYRGAPITLRVVAAPREADIAVSGGRLEWLDAAQGILVATLDAPQVGTTPICLTATRKRQVSESCLSAVVHEPQMIGGIDRWGALSAQVGRTYDPSSDWQSLQIPQAHYQTVVEFDGATVFHGPGTRFDVGSLPPAMTLASGVKSIRTRVYWRPGGTADMMQWVVLASTDPSDRAIVALGTRRMSVAE
jgi:hypothetical protein